MHVNCTVKYLAFIRNFHLYEACLMFHVISTQDLPARVRVDNVILNYGIDD